MAEKFNLDEYVPVSERLQLFRSEYPNGRIVTDMLKFENGVAVVKASVFREADDAEPAATGHAFEIEGDGYVNQTSVLENCETSSIGRALANLGYSITKGIASREEMQKVERMTQGRSTGSAPIPQDVAQPMRNVERSTTPIMGQQTGEGNPNVSRSLDTLVSAPQLKMMREMAKERDKDLDIFCLQHMDCVPDELTKRAASELIDILKKESVPEKAKAAAVGSTGDVTAPQLATLAKIAKGYNVTIMDLADQKEIDISDPTELSKAQASQLIKEYGIGKK
jgi:hypothetical protein